jgi:hypothetical protein
MGSTGWYQLDLKQGWWYKGKDGSTGSVTRIGRLWHTGYTPAGRKRAVWGKNYTTVGAAKRAVVAALKKG